ncbi:MAG: DegT/DnrJ/EryC1/StrS family aminotransferase [bacterium]|nr:DegT/DnrJ/EryC1/StrS family aminotransferase [bacterium]
MDIQKVDFFRHNIEEQDIERCNEVLRSVFLATGKVVEQLEDQLSAYLNLPHAIAVTSCTEALQLCLMGLGIGPGDEVITTPMTFCATSNVILHVGATPVFVDVRPEDGNMDPALIEAKITERTKAIIPIHLYGRMADMRAISTIAQKHGLKLIEDAAHCLEGERDGVKPGQLGDAACFSFYATKNITSGEGGAIATKDEALAERLKPLRLHGIDKTAADRYTKSYQHWDMRVLGLKANMSNIQAALLVGQLERIESLWNRRESLAKRYEQALAGLPGVVLKEVGAQERSGRHLMTIQVAPAKRDACLKRLQELGVGVAVNFRAVHLLEYYRSKFGFHEGDFPVAESIGGGTISLPLYPLLSEAELDYVVAQVKQVAQELL